MKNSLRKDQRGLGHIMIVFLVVAVIAAVGIVGYRVLHKQKAPADKTAHSKNISDQASCMKVYHDKTLCTFAVQNAELGNLAYTAIDNSTDTVGQTTQVTIKNDGKGNMSINSKAGDQTYDSVTIGNTVYVNGNNSGWLKYTTDAPEVVNPASKLKTSFSDSDTPKDQQTTYKKIGQEKCGKDSCIKYQVFDPTAAGTNYIWISTSTNRLMHWNNKSSDGTNDLVITYGPVTITAPANATDGNAAAAETQAEVQAAQQAAGQY